MLTNTTHIILQENNYHVLMHNSVYYRHHTLPTGCFHQLLLVMKMVKISLDECTHCIYKGIYKVGVKGFGGART